MHNHTTSLRLTLFAALAGAMATCALTGCKPGAFSAAPSGPGAQSVASTPNQQLLAQQQVEQMKGAWLAQQQSLTSQVQDLTRRTSQLDLNNTNLTRELAQAQQQQQQYAQQIEMLKSQLGETANRLKSEQVASQETNKQLQALQASTTFRGGASITANSSAKQALATITIPNLEIRQEGDVVRIDIPADKLFAPGSAQLTPEAGRILDEVASAIVRNYPRQRVIIEGHSDNTPGSAVNAHLLTNAQSQIVFQHFVQRNNLPTRQLSILAMGENLPIASNATPAGQAKNRRIEIVVYPSTIDG